MKKIEVENLVHCPFKAVLLPKPKNRGDGKRLNVYTIPYTVFATSTLYKLVPNSPVILYYTALYNSVVLIATRHSALLIKF